MRLPGGLTLRLFYAGLFTVAVGLLWTLITGWHIWRTLSLVFFVGAVPVIYVVSALSVDPKGRAVLVTGCDTGFGHQLARYLHNLGFHVFAGCLVVDGPGWRHLDQLGKESGRLDLVALDITSDESLERARRFVVDRLPAGGLWALVNNAGLGGHGYIEWTSMTTYKKVVDVNVFGTIRATKTFLPLIRRTKGRVVNVSSTLGRQTGPFMSAYSMTKFAMEAFSDSLRLELGQFKVKVCVVEPGNHIAGTGIQDPERVAKETTSMWDALDDQMRCDYGEKRLAECIDLNKKFVTCGRSDITPVIDSMADAVCRLYPETRYMPATLITRTLFFLAHHVPDFLIDMAIAQFPAIKCHT